MEITSKWNPTNNNNKKKYAKNTEKERETEYPLVRLERGINKRKIC